MKFKNFFFMNHDTSNLFVQFGIPIILSKSLKSFPVDADCETSFWLHSLCTCTILSSIKIHKSYVPQLTVESVRGLVW